jgi:flagellar M-ring protein FliF
MNITIKGMLNQFLEFWNKQDKKKKIIVISVLVSLIAIAVVTTFLLNQTNYVVLYRGLSSSEGNQIATKLQAMSVDNKVENDGTILVPAKDEARLKMQLSAEGFPKSALTYDIFTNNSSFTTTDFEKKQYLIFQLQNRLQDSIKTLSGVNNAIVTISVSDQSSFVLADDKVPTTASVILDLQSGASLSSQQVKGVESLVAKSVPGLENKNVTIIDNTGAILNNSSSDSTVDAASTKLDMQNKASSIIEGRIVSLLQPVFGKTGISVAANVVIDYQQKTSQVTKYDPVVGQNGIISKIDQTKENVSGSINSTVSTASSSSATGSNVPTYGTGNSQATTVGGSEKSTIDYLVNQVQEQIQADGGEIKDLTVAVMINKKSLSAAESTSIKQMVAFAVGVTQDKVNVANMDFTAANDLKSLAQKALSAKPFSLSSLALYAIPVVTCFVILVVVLISIKNKRNNSFQMKKELLDELEFESRKLTKNNIENIPSAIVLNETREQDLKRQIKGFSSTNPEIVAQLLRTWIDDEDE